MLGVVAISDLERPLDTIRTIPTTASINPLYYANHQAAPFNPPLAHTSHLKQHHRERWIKDTTKGHGHQSQHDLRFTGSDATGSCRIKHEPRTPRRTTTIKVTSVCFSR